MSADADPGFTILHETGGVLVLNKPYGLLTQAPPWIDSLESRIRRFLSHREPFDPVYLGMPHRLDRPVSGAIVVACRKRDARKISKQFERRTVHKTYWCCVHGRVEPPSGLWEDFLRKIPDHARAEVVAPDHPEGRVARLEYLTLASLGLDEQPVSLLLIQLHTGRTHQIRVQAASRGHPVWGDQQYGSSVLFGPEQSDPREQPIVLHARTLAFDDPATKERTQITAPLPPVWQVLNLPDSLLIEDDLGECPVGDRG